MGVLEMLISVKKLGICSALLVGLLSVCFEVRTQEPAAPSKSDFEELQKLAKQLPKMSKEERGDLIGKVTSYLKERKTDLDKKDGALTEKICDDLHKVEAAQANMLYADWGNLLSKSSAKEVAQLGKRMVGFNRQLNLVGKELEIKARTLDDKEFDWKGFRKDFQGKVILVDFWATWCGPCLAAMPHLVKLHESYKDRGFDIVGLSIDDKIGTVETFFEQRLEKVAKVKKLPWTNIVDPSLEIAFHYGVKYIPFTLLVDREGKVLAVNPSNAELDRLLEKHLGAKAEK